MTPLLSSLMNTYPKLFDWWEDSRLDYLGLKERDIDIIHELFGENILYTGLISLLCFTHGDSYPISTIATILEIDPNVAMPYIQELTKRNLVYSEVFGGFLQHHFVDRDLLLQLIRDKKTTSAKLSIRKIIKSKDPFQRMHSLDLQVKEQICPAYTEEENVNEPYLAHTHADNRIKDIEKTQKEFTDFSIALEKYIELVNQFEEEQVYQEYLKEYPNIISLQIVDSYSKFRFAAELIPDFLVILHDYSHLLVEIEKPSKKIFTGAGIETAEYRHAIQQVREYVSWAQGELDFLRKRGCPKINQNNVRGLLVIGHSSDLSDMDMKRLERINFEYKGLYSIKTFDQLYNERIQDIRTLGWK